MNEIKPYILSVVSVALLCSTASKIYPGEGASRQLIKSISGMLLLLTIARPIFHISYTGPRFLPHSFSEDAASAVGEGKAQMVLALQNSIKQRAQAYILDKAADYGAQIDVDICLSNDDMPVPISAVIVGDVSPYVKAQLEHILLKDLGIAAKEQIWK